MSTVARVHRLFPLVGRAWLLVLLAFLLISGPAFAQTEPAFPPLTGRVVDAANILSGPTRDALAAKLKAQEDRTSDQVVVATVPSLGGLEIEDYANRLFRAWKLGQAARNNGVLFLVAPTERRVRIEVGYGVEGGLTDAVAGTIIRTVVTPRFRTGDFAGGITAGTDAVLSVLARDAEQWGRQAEPRKQQDLSGTDILFAIFWVVIFLLILRSVFRGGGTTRAHRSRRGGWIVPGGFGGGFGGGSSWGGGFGGGFGGGGGGFSGGGGSSGGGGASGSW